MTRKTTDGLIATAEKELSHINLLIMDRRSETLKWARRHLDIIKSCGEVCDLGYLELVGNTLNALYIKILNSPGDHWMVQVQEDVSTISELQDNAREIQNNLVALERGVIK